MPADLLQLGVRDLLRKLVSILHRLKVVGRTLALGNVRQAGTNWWIPRKWMLLPWR